MRFQEIPAPQWASTLGVFGLHHFGWSVQLERKPDGASRKPAGNSFLEEIALDSAAGQQQIRIVLGSPFRPFHTHVVGNPCRIRIAAGVQAALEIESADGISIVMHCRRPDTMAK